MKLGSHNTMTYLNPQWYFWPLKWTSKCQKLNYKQQFEHGARFFDLRVSFDKKGMPYFCHGLAKYTKVTPWEVLAWLDVAAKTEEIWVRVMNEHSDNHELFGRFVHDIQDIYKNIQFCSFLDKNDWSVQWPSINRKTGEEKFIGAPVIDCYASSNQTGVNKWKGILKSKNWSGLLIDDLWPWIYAKLNNKKTLEKYKDENDKFVTMDFIGTV